MGYKKHFIKSFSWMSLLLGLTRAISLIKYVVIARIILPSELGLFAIIIFVLTLVEVITELGIKNYLIQIKNTFKTIINVAWTLQVIRGLILSGVILIFSFPLSLFFKQEDLFYLFLYSAIIPLIRSLENIYVINFQKELKFNNEFYYRMLIILVDLVFSIILTYIFKSALGLIMGVLISTLISILFTWVYIKEKPKIEINFYKFKELLGYSKWMNLNSIFYYLISNLDNLIIGKFLGTGQLGLYNMAQNFSFRPMQEISDLVGKITFPYYSKISDDLARLRGAYLKISILLSLFTLFIGGFLYLYSEQIIVLFLGEKWLLAKDIYKLLIVYGVLTSIISTNGSLLYSLGKQDILGRISLFRLGIFIILTLLFFNFINVTNLVIFLIISLLIIFPLNYYYLYKIFKFNKK